MNIIFFYSQRFPKLLFPVTIEVLPFLLEEVKKNLETEVSQTLTSAENSVHLVWGGLDLNYKLLENSCQAQSDKTF